MNSLSSKELRQQIRGQLSAVYQHHEADQLAAMVIDHHFGISPTKQLISQELQMLPSIKEHIELKLERLLKHEPIQYVLGSTEFYGYEFKTDTRALIPRPETEELVRWVLDTGLTNKSKVLDIGTGSGCIAITLSLEAGANVYALEAAPAALELAQENAQHLKAPVQFLQVDIMSKLPDLPMFDVLISNPPYVPDGDLDTIEPRVKDFEPASALFVPDHDPLKFFKRIAELAPCYLKPGGRVFLEIYHSAGPAVSQLFQGSDWSQVSIKQDLQGMDRMVLAHYQGAI